MAPPRLEFVQVPADHAIRIRASVVNSNAARLKVQYINRGNPAEDEMFSPPGSTFERFIHFDEPELHTLIFVAFRGDEEDGAALRVELVDQNNQAVIFPGNPTTPFSGVMAALQLGVLNF